MTCMRGRSSMRWVRFDPLSIRAKFKRSLGVSLREASSEPSRVAEDSGSGQPPTHQGEAAPEEPQADLDSMLLLVQQGRFGVCEDCGAGIDVERILAMPWVTRCPGCERLRG
jgi:RNA polymerase-binding transcription factor DksA